MPRFGVPHGQPTLADRLFGRGFGVDVILILAGMALTSIAAQVIIPVWPIPITGQTVAVLLVGLALGPLRGATSLTLYAACGAAGLPIFSNGSFGVDAVLGQTGGYIVGFIAAAALVGWMAQRGLDRSLLVSVGVAACGTAAIYLVGLPWLAISRSLTLEETFQIGLYPLVLGGLVKLLLVAVVHTAALGAVTRMEQRDERRAARTL